jgi:CRP/FNR family transcriptional regulator, anaerobic regulatory protein
VAGDKNSKVVSIAQLRQTCRSCSLRDLCLPLGLGADDMQKLEAIVHTRGPIRSSEHLFREGDSFQALYAVKSGALKTCTIDSQGREHVLGFHIAGELVGLDGIHSGHNRCNAVALQTTSVCALPFPRLEQLIHDIPGLQTQVLRILSRELSSSAQLATDHSAEERLAGFLVSLLRRYARRGLPSESLFLPMPRRDIASHLRLATETVSRLFARFQEEGMIEVRRREVKVLDSAALEALGASFDLDDNGARRRSPQSR